MRIVSFIFARKGSQGIKNKNLLKFKKTSLLGNSILQSRKSRYIQRTFVSTDSKKIAKEAKRNKAEVPFIRPKHLAKNKSPEIHAWRHATEFLDKKLTLVSMNPPISLILEPTFFVNVYLQILFVN